MTSKIVYYTIGFTKSTTKFLRQINKSRGGDLLILEVRLQNKTSFVSFRVMFSCGNKNFIQNKR